MRIHLSEQLLPFLLNPRSYPHRPRTVRLLQTHSSFVFLAGPFVFKIKKPVNFGFLDFSTLEKRRYFCAREVELNRRLCPKVYLGVVPICRRRDRLGFDEGDEVVEVAVKMRKLSERYFLKRLVQHGQVRKSDLDRVVRVLKKFYQAQTPTAEIEAWGQIDRLKISTEENFGQTEAFVAKTISRRAFEAIRTYTNQFYAQHATLFRNRIRQRWIRDCHGDLHLDHIHLTPHSVHIYDCIEFNDRLRYIDVANDVAFLAMDLDFNHRPDLARHFAVRMARALQDPDLPRLLDFYRCYRAYVRGKVESLHSVAPEAPEAEREAVQQLARRYFQLALQYAVAGSHPVVLIVMGRIASGKSVLANALADELGWPIFSSDRLRKEMAGFPLFERTAAAARAKLYSHAMTRRTYAALLCAAAQGVSSGQSVLLDATFGRREWREQLRQLLSRKDIPYQFIEARVSDRVARRRLEAREGQAGEISDARPEDFALLSRCHQPPQELAAHELLIVNSDGPVEKTLAELLRELATRRARFG
jgi:hypothetical protein